MPEDTCQVLEDKLKTTQLKEDTQDTTILGKSSKNKSDILLTSEPFAYVVKSLLRNNYCDHCLRKRRQGLQRCSSCTCVYYCNRECQKEGWKVHKKECICLRKSKPKYPPDTARLLARIIFRLQENGYEVEEKYGENKSRRFRDLMNHYNDVKEDILRQEHFTSLLAVLTSYIGESNMPNSAELLGIYGRVCVNSFRITDKDLNAIGTGIYLSGSIFDHSCRPNAYASFIGSQLTVRTLIDWKEFDWNKVRISYIDVLNNIDERKRELQEGYFFTCDCSWCNNEKVNLAAHSINCGNSSCTYPIALDPEEDPEMPLKPCPQCGFTDFDGDTRRKFSDITTFSEEKLMEMQNKSYLDVCRKLIDRQGSLLHPLNLTRSRTLDAAFEACIDHSCWEDAVKYGSENLQGINAEMLVFPPTYGNFCHVAVMRDKGHGKKDMILISYEL